MISFPEPSEGNSFLVEHVIILRNSLRHWTNRNLINFALDDVEAARYVFHAPFAIVSHDTALDPIFNYSNQTALKLFEMSWADFTSLKSRKSAESVNQEERAKLLLEVKANGFIDNYRGIRISQSGKRFLIERATVWNLLDQNGDYYGQAAMFSNWQYL